MGRPFRLTRTTSVGTVVKLKFEPVDDVRVRILEYRRRKPGQNTFRRVPEEVGMIVRLDQLPPDDGGGRDRP